MRPNVDINWSSHGTIKEIAATCYDGDLDRAYNEVLERGLEYSAIPCEEQMETGSLENIVRIPIKGAGTPITFHEFLGQDTPLYSTGYGPYKTLAIEDLEEQLRTISRYSAVAVDTAAFGIRRDEANWVGWGFGDFIKAVSSPLDRYRETDLNELAHEEVGLVFSVGDDYVTLRGRHFPDDRSIGDLHAEVLASGRPIRSSSSLEAVLHELDVQLINASEVSDQAHRPLTGASFTPKSVGTVSYVDRSREWVDKVVIKNPFETGQLDHQDPTLGAPENVIIHLTDHKLASEGSPTQYQVKNHAVTLGDIANISIVGTWS